MGNYLLSLKTIEDYWKYMTTIFMKIFLLQYNSIECSHILGDMYSL